MLPWLFAGLLASAAAAPRSLNSERTEWVYAKGHAAVGPHKDGLVVVLEAENMGKHESKGNKTMTIAFPRSGPS